MLMLKIKRFCQNLVILFNIWSISNLPGALLFDLTVAIYCTKIKHLAKLSTVYSLFYLSRTNELFNKFFFINLI